MRGCAFARVLAAHVATFAPARRHRVFCAIQHCDATLCLNVNARRNRIGRRSYRSAVLARFTRASHTDAKSTPDSPTRNTIVNVIGTYICRLHMRLPV